MEYIPEEIRRMGVEEKSPGEATSLSGIAIIRRLPVTKFETIGGELSMTTTMLPLPMTISADRSMLFGTENIAAREYFKRVIENGDMIDAVVIPQTGAAFPLRSFWIRIEYVGTPPPAGTYSKKDDGLFALRAKAGEKAERVVTRHLRDNFGHSFQPGMCDSAGFFEIRYDNKKLRKPDRKCLVCGLTLEIKKRNKDTHFRVSHSAGRTFTSENATGANEWHAFVFPDMKPRFVPNAAIAQAIAQGRFRAGKDQYDAWVDINEDAIVLSDPPHCSC